jgi:PAS domain S-box-containing protein
MNYLKKELYELVKSDEEIFDFIQDASVDGLWYWDVENPENEWMNPRFWKTLGYNPDEMPHKASAWQSIIHPDDLKLTLENFKKHCENPDHPYDQVVRYTHKNGSIMWIRCRGIAIRNKKGKAVRMLGAHIDVTKEKESEEKNSLLFNSIDEGFCIIEMIFNEQKKPVDYRFLVINASFERQTGLVNAVGKRMREFAPNHEEHWFETYGKIALTGESIRFENRAEQLHRWYDVYAFRFGDPKNMQVAILFNDITQRKEAEDTITLLNKELADNLLRIESANKELESFSYSVSHDLRAPLRAINGYAKIVSEDFAKELPQEARQYIESICRNSEKMGNLIDDLLAFSRLGRKEIEKKLVNTEKMVQNIIEDMCNQYSIKKNIFKVGDLPPIYGDNSLLKQVWVNLLSNAYKYSRKNPSPLIEIGTIKNGQEISYYIKDNGVGFDMQYYNKLFGVFQRLHNETEFEGTGVGLAIVQKIIIRHGGNVWGEAKVNEGACFYFTIPAFDPSTPPQPGGPTDTNIVGKPKKETEKTVN